MSNGHRGPKGPIKEPSPGYCPNPGGTGVHTPPRLLGIELAPSGFADGAPVEINCDDPDFEAMNAELARLRRDLATEVKLHMGDHEILKIVTGLQGAHMMKPLQAKDWAERNLASIERERSQQEEIGELRLEVSQLPAAGKNLTQDRNNRLRDNADLRAENEDLRRRLAKGLESVREARQLIAERRRP